MFEKKYRILLTQQEKSLIIEALIEFKNELHRQGRYTDAVDELLIKMLR